MQKITLLVPNLFMPYGHANVWVAPIMGHRLSLALALFAFTLWNGQGSSLLRNLHCFSVRYIISFSTPTLAGWFPNSSDALSGGLVAHAPDGATQACQLTDCDPVTCSKGLLMRLSLWASPLNQHHCTNASMLTNLSMPDISRLLFTIQPRCLLRRTVQGVLWKGWACISVCPGKRDCAMSASQ